MEDGTGRAAFGFGDDRNPVETCPGLSGTGCAAAREDAASAPAETGHGGRTIAASGNRQATNRWRRCRIAQHRQAGKRQERLGYRSRVFFMALNMAVPAS